jgi:GH24 family phage-related lysozyme (muramidase)
MIDRQALTNSIKTHEGYSKKAYRDSLDVLTVGWGHNVAFIEEETNHREWLRSDIETAIHAASKWLGDVWESTSDRRQAVVAEMFFQLGASRMALFEKLRAALLGHDYAEAAHQMRLSRWFTQTPERAGELLAIMEAG